MSALSQRQSPVSTTTATVVVAIGVVVLIGWIGDWPLLTNWFLSATSMKADTAIAFICAGVALELRNRKAPSKRLRQMAAGLAAATAILGLATLVEYVFGLNLGHDWSMQALPRGASAHPLLRPMAPATAVALWLLGSSLVIGEYRAPLAIWLFQSSLLVAFVIGLLTIIGYFHGVADFFHLSGFESVAPIAALGLMLLSAGTLCARPSVGMMHAFTAPYLGGQMVRRVWLPTLLGVVLLDAVVRLGKVRFGDAAADLFVVIGILVIVSLAIWVSTRALNRSHLRILHRDRLYAVLSQTNLSIVRLKEREVLYRQICRIAVVSGQFRAAWIGLVDRRLAPPSLEIIAQDGAPLSSKFRDLALRAVVENRSLIAQETANLLADDEGDNTVSGGAFPIAHVNGVHPVLVVESAESGFFHQEEIDLLKEVADDVAFALAAMDQEDRRHAAEHAARESQERLKLATAAAKMGFWDWDIVSDRMQFSPEWKEQLGLGDIDVADTREELQSRVHPEDALYVTRELGAFLAGGAGGAYAVEYRLRHQDGSYRWVYSRGRAFHDPNNRPVRMVGWHVDITAQKQAEEAVRERETRLQIVIENLTEGLVIADLSGQLLQWNRAAIEMHGFDRAEDLKLKLPDFIKIYEMSTLDGRVLDYDQWPMPRIFRGDQLRNLDLRIRRIDTPWARIFSYGGTLVQGPGGPALAFLTITDITARTEALSAVRESEARFRELADHVDEVFWITDPVSHVALYVSSAYEKIWGRPCDEIYHDMRSWSNAIHPDDRERVRAAAASKQVQGEYDETFRIVRPDGSIRWVRDRAFPVRKGDGHVYRIVGTAQDITATMIAEIHHGLQHGTTAVFAEARTLTEAAEKVISLVCRSMDWTFGELWILDRPAACLRCAEVWHPPSPELAAFAIRARETTFTLGRGLPGRIWRENGPLWLADLASDPIFERKTDAAFASLHSAFGLPVFLRDEVIGVLAFYAKHIREPDEDMLHITANLSSQFGQFIQRVRIEEQFRQAQKMEAVGQLAGGVAHDFNNLLTVMKAYPQLIALTPNITDEARDWLQQISTAADRAAGLTRQLLAFSRKQVMQIHPLNLSVTVENMGSMLRRVIGADISLVFDCPLDLPLIEADSGMMEQVLLNLVINARDAMPQGGQLVISTRVEDIDTLFLRERPRARRGSFLTLSVRDTGLGMSPEVLAHIFEPFFTTKGPGKGTGLGLATVYGIAEQHHGWIEAESVEDRGSTFKAFFPIAAKAPAVVPEKKPVIAMPRGRETILLVEDEPAVRVLSKVILERLGYRVFDAVSGVVALEIWAQRRGDISLLVTDMVMPHGVTGRALAEQLRLQNPQLRVLFTTGYSPASVAKGLNLIEGVNFIQKPYVPLVLSEAVRKCLERQPEPLS